MARKTNIDRAELQRFARREAKRKTGGKTERKYVLIVCEGEQTEPNYFKSLRSSLPRGTVEVEIEGTGANTASLIAEAARIRAKREAATGRRFDATWAVFDRDSFPADHFDNAIRQGGQSVPPIHCAWSNEAFELWYLLHLEYISTGMPRHDYKVRIERWLTERMGKPFSYRKNREDMYQVLQQYGSEAQAGRWARQLEHQHTGTQFASHNPCTRVYLLVEALNALRSS